VVNRCIHQDCDQQWRLFGTGAVYALERRATDSSSRHTEFFWLCPSCVQRFAVCKDSKGGVVTRPRSEVLHPTPPDPDLDLRLVFHPKAVLASIEAIREDHICVGRVLPARKATRLEAVA
jgi:hypothetical protein